MAAQLQPVQVQGDGSVINDGPAITLRPGQVAPSGEGAYVRVGTAQLHKCVPSGVVSLIDVQVDGQALDGRYLIRRGHIRGRVAEFWLLRAGE